MNEEEAEDPHALIKRAVFGEQVQEFMNTEVGRYIIERAQNQVLEALLKLKTCDPENPGLIREYQGQIEVAESIPQWLGDAVKDGLTALRIIEDRE